MMNELNPHIAAMARELGVSPGRLAEAMQKHMPYGTLNTEELEERIRSEVRRHLEEPNR